MSNVSGRDERGLYVTLQENTLVAKCSNSPTPLRSVITFSCRQIWSVLLKRKAQSGHHNDYHLH